MDVNFKNISCPICGGACQQEIVQNTITINHCRNSACASNGGTEDYTYFLRNNLCRFKQSTLCWLVLFLLFIGFVGGLGMSKLQQLQREDQCRRYGRYCE